MRRAASRRLLTVIAAGVVFGAGYASGSYSATLAAARRRVERRSRLAQTRFGALEYAIAGRGEPFLMIHGTGGGFDQGLRFGHGLIARGFEVIAPSRFGYLRSEFPADPSPASQADAFADLLDHLNIDRLPVAGGSAGALPAAHFALRHPDRCTQLVLLVPAMNLGNRDPVAFTPLQQFLVSKLLTSELWFWALSKVAANQLIGTLLATDPRLLRTVSESERKRAYTILDELMPISRRSRGMLNDGHFAGSPACTCRMLPNSVNLRNTRPIAACTLAPSRSPPTISEGDDRIASSARRRSRNPSTDRRGHSRTAIAAAGAHIQIGICANVPSGWRTTNIPTLRKR